MSDNILRQSWSRVNIDVGVRGYQATVSLLGRDIHRKMIFTFTKNGEPLHPPAGCRTSWRAHSSGHTEETTPTFRRTEKDTLEGWAVVCQLEENSPIYEGVYNVDIIFWGADNQPIEDVGGAHIHVVIREGTAPPTLTDQSGFDAVRDLICIFGQDAQGILDLVEQISKDANALEAELPRLEIEVHNVAMRVDSHTERLEEDLAEETNTRKERDETVRVFIEDQMGKITTLVQDAIGNLESLEGDEADAVATVNAIPGIVEDVPDLLESSRDDEWIGAYCFYKRTIPQGIEIHPGVKHIGNYAFAQSLGCSVVLPPGLKAIGEHAFDRCDQTALAIPAGVEYIGDHALDLGSSAAHATLTFDGTIPLLPCPVIDTTYLDGIWVPAGCGDAYRQAWPDLADLISPKTT